MQERLECGKLEEKMKEISKEISCGCVTVDDQLSSDVDLLMEQKIHMLHHSCNYFGKNR